MPLESFLGDSAVIVYPDAVVRRIWADQFATHWGKFEDLPFFDALVSTMRSAYCIDDSRVFAVGWSSGGYFANQLGCARSPVLRAVASLSGGGPEEIACDRAMPVFLYHDRDDSKVTYATGRASLRAWTRTNGCADRIRRWGETGCVTFSSCGDSSTQAQVVWCETEHQGHAVPRTVTRDLAAFLQSL